MSAHKPSVLTRRDLLMASGRVAAAAAVTGLVRPRVYAGESSRLRLALIGCGERGAGAACDALSVEGGELQLVAMADVLDEKLKISHRALSQKLPEQTAVPPEQKFIGFDAYRQAMDCLNPGDIVILTTPPAFRWVHFSYAVQRGLNVFMEKPVAVDGPTARKMFELADQARQKNLKVGVGLMCRHCDARGELFNRIQDGELGDLVLLRAYRMAGPTGSAFVPTREQFNRERMSDYSELLYQIINFHGFLWASGGAYSDFLIHNVDECCWMKNDWPVEAKASGGRHFRGDFVDQNFDNYAVEYTFADGAKLFLEGRTMIGCKQEFASYAHGSRNSAIISTSSHFPAKSRIYQGQHLGSPHHLIWEYPKPERNLYQLEWDRLIDAIRNDRPYNEVSRGVQASLVTSMGRMAAHTGQVVTYDQMFNCEHEFATGVDQLMLDGPAPLLATADGKYPIPMPGLQKRQEY